MMSYYASILLKIIIDTYLNNCVDNAHNYMKLFDADMQLDPSLEHDTLYQCYEKLSDEEIKAISSAIIKVFFLEIGVDCASNEQLKSFLNDFNSITRKDGK